MTGSQYFVPVSSGGSSSKAGSFQGHTLIIPTVSHASVPQLATDLLLNAPELSVTKVGRLNVSGDVIPFVGPDESTGLTTALEVYSNHPQKLTVLQQRSPVIKSRKANFVKQLTRWIQEENFKQVLILSSIDASLRVDDELNTPVVHALHAERSASATDLLEKLQSSCPPWMDAENQNQSRIQSKAGHSLPTSTGLAGRLLNALSNSNSSEANDLASIPVGVLLLFAAEGDNRTDAHLLARTAFHLLTDSEPTGLRTLAAAAHAQQDLFREPASWAGVFGNAYDQRVYG